MTFSCFALSEKHELLALGIPLIGNEKTRLSNNERIETLE